MKDNFTREEILNIDISSLEEMWEICRKEITMGMAEAKLSIYYVDEVTLLKVINAFKNFYKEGEEGSSEKIAEMILKLIFRKKMNLEFLFKMMVMQYIEEREK